MLRVKQNRVPVFLYRNQGGTADIPSLFLGEWISFFMKFSAKEIMIMDMKERLQELAEAARKRIEESDVPEKLNEVKVAYLGKKVNLLLF